MRKSYLDFEANLTLLDNDEDWFTFALDEAKLVTFDLGNSYHDSLYWELYDVNLNRSGIYHYEGSPFSKALSAGQHYLRLSSYGAANFSYPLRLSAVKLPDHDLEPNDSFNDAKVVSLPYQRELYMARQDQDWFSFSLASEQVVSFNIQSQSHYAMSGTLYRSNGSLVENFYLNSNGTTLTILPAGTYRIQLANHDYSEDSYAYTFALTSESIPDTAYEPNNTLQQAYGIQLGFASDFLLVSGQDSDFFKFVLNSATQVTIDLEPVVGGYLDAYLQNESGSTYQHLSQGPNTPVLPAGTYYLHFSSYGSTIKYKFSIRKT